MSDLPARPWRLLQLLITTLKEMLMFEKILSLIERAVAALEKLASASSSAPVSGALTAGATTSDAPAKTPRKPKPEAPTPPPAADDFLNEPEAAPEEKTYERADVKAALQEYGKKNGMDKAQKLFQEVSGVKSLSDLPIEKFATVINATKK